MTYFEALGLEPTLALDDAQLKKRFYDATRQWHPDRFSRASQDEQQKALDMTALINDAYRSLRDPVTRAEYYLELQGIGPSKTPSPELLEEMFELNMELDELRERGEHEAANQRYLAMQAEVDAQLTVPMEPLRLRDLLDRRRYISNLLQKNHVHLSN